MKISEFKKEIKLENEGQLQLFFIGTGSAFNKKSFQNNLLVIKGKKHVLIDCGNICPYALSTYNTPIAKIEYVLPTHSHADHIGGLEEMALAGRYIANRKPKMIITDEYKKILWNDSLKGGCAYGDSCTAGTLMTLDDYFEQLKPVEIKNAPRPFYEAKLGGLIIKLFRTTHIYNGTDDWKKKFYSVGVLIDDRVLFTGDTQFDPELLNWLTKDFNLEAIFHDCQLYDGGVHANYKELKTLPKEIKSKMWLCHYGENYKDYNPEKDGFAGFAERGKYYNF